jgi:hypothetical protein
LAWLGWLFGHWRSGPLAYLPSRVESRSRFRQYLYCILNVDKNQT